VHCEILPHVGTLVQKQSKKSTSGQIQDGGQLTNCAKIRHFANRPARATAPPKIYQSSVELEKLTHISPIFPNFFTGGGSKMS